MDYWTVYMVAREEHPYDVDVCNFSCLNDIYYLRFVCSMSYSRAIQKKKKSNQNKTKQKQNKKQTNKQTKNKNKQTNKNLISSLFTLLALLNLLKCVSPTCFYNKNKKLPSLKCLFSKCNASKSFIKGNREIMLHINAQLCCNNVCIMDMMFWQDILMKHCLFDFCDSRSLILQRRPTMQCSSAMLCSVVSFCDGGLTFKAKPSGSRILYTTVPLCNFLI